MCGRYSLTVSSEEFEQFSSFRLPYGADAWPARYNIAPSQNCPVLLVENDQIEVRLLKWGFNPDWLKSNGHVPPPINARSDSVDSKPYFKQAFEKRRCLIPATSFFEWTNNTEKSTRRTPYKISIKNHKIIYFAGIWEGETFCIVTRESIVPLKKFHHRMPLILINDEETTGWLQGSQTVAKALATKDYDFQIEITQVNTLVNSASCDTPEVLELTRQLTLL